MRVRIGIRAGVGLGLLGAAGVAVVVGAYPLVDVGALADRVWPVLLFAIAMTVVAELASEAGVFDVASGLVRRLAGGHPWVLWLLVAALATLCTVVLSLDTTAVLLTPVAIALARRVGMDPRPFALTTVWLANTASLLLPISNLTNLLAEQRMGAAGPWSFAAVTWVAWIACTVLPLLVIAMVFRRLIPAVGPVGSARTSEAHPADPRLVRTIAIVLALLVVALLTGVAFWIPAVVAALVLLVVVGRRRPGVVGPSLVPWRMLLLTLGLFAATGAASAAVLHGLLETLPPFGDGFAGLLAVAAIGAGGANLVNNLPAYLVLEPIAHAPAQLAALLVGVNAGPLLTPWASLATLLWHERLVADGVRISWRRYARFGLVVVPLLLVAGAAGIALVA